MTALTAMIPPEWTEVLDALTYRPNVKFEVRAPGYRGDSLHGLLFEIHATVPDSRYPNDARTITVVHSFAVPYMFDDRNHIIAFVRHCIHSMERHEADEFLRIDGELVNDPHADDRFR